MWLGIVGHWQTLHKLLARPVISAKKFKIAIVSCQNAHRSYIFVTWYPVPMWLGIVGHWQTLHKLLARPVILAKKFKWYCNSIVPKCAQELFLACDVRCPCGQALITFWSRDVSATFLDIVVAWSCQWLHSCMFLVLRYWLLETTYKFCTLGSVTCGRVEVHLCAWVHVNNHCVPNLIIHGVPQNPGTKYWLRQQKCVCYISSLCDPHKHLNIT
jgi:hypothetical protein